MLARFEARYRPARSLSATFMEEYTENGRVTRKEAGKAYFLRPGKMRWDYEAPEKNMFLADGKYVWFYTPADRTVTRMPSKASDDWRTPLAFLTTDMKLSRVCSRIDPAVDEKPAQAGDFVYRCQLRSKNADTDIHSSSKNTNSVVFELSPQGELNRILIEEQAGVQLEFSFRNWQWNPPLAKSIFQFDPPPNVVIVNGLLSDSPRLRQ